MSSKEKRIGLVGVGRMGANMARNLKDKGYQVSCVNDAAKDVASSLAEELNWRPRGDPCRGHGQLGHRPYRRHQ